MKRTKKRPCELVAKNLKPHEKLLIDRRRRGLNQSDAAEEWGMTLAEYSRMERGVEEYHPVTGSIECGVVSLSVVEVHEACMIHRLRSGRVAKELAKSIGCTPYWLSRMERGSANSDLLADWWDAELARP